MNGRTVVSKWGKTEKCDEFEVQLLAMHEPKVSYGLMHGQLLRPLTEEINRLYAACCEIRNEPGGRYLKAYSAKYPGAELGIDLVIFEQAFEVDLACAL